MQCEYHDVSLGKPRVRDQANDYKDGCYFRSCVGMANMSAIVCYLVLMEPRLHSPRGVHPEPLAESTAFGRCVGLCGHQVVGSASPAPLRFHTGLIVGSQSAGRIGAKEMQAAAQGTRMQNDFHYPAELEIAPIVIG